MALFKKAGPATASSPVPRGAWPGPAHEAGPSPADEAGPTLREKIGQLSAAIDVFVSGDFRDSGTTSTIVECVGAGLAPLHFPEQSIWARSIPFADRAAAIGEWLIIVKLYQLCAYWNDQAGPELSQKIPQFCEMVGWARPGDRAALRDKAFDAAQRLEASLMLFPFSNERVGEIVLTESVYLNRVADWLARTEPPPPAPPTTRERIDAVLERARAGDADAILYEKALTASTDEEARQLLEQAAMLGSVDAMEAAAEMCAATGNTQAEAFWAESAANAGSIKGMNQLAYICSGAGREAEAVSWLEKAGQAGDLRAFELLSKMTNQNGDHAAAERWAEAGAAHGHAECLRLKGSYMINRAGLGERTAESIEKAAVAHTWLVEAARRGSDKAMVQAGMLAELLGPAGQAAYWYTRAASLGNPDAQERLSQGRG